MGKAVPFSTGRETRGILALRLQRHAKSWGSAVYQGSSGQGVGLTWLLIHWRKLRMPGSGEHPWMRHEGHVYMWFTIEEFVYKYWAFVLRADSQQSQHKHSTTQSSAISQKPLFNMQFSTSFLVAALFGTAFAMPQANPTDCPQTSAIPTCGVSQSCKAAVFQVLTMFLRLLASPLPPPPSAAATLLASAPALAPFRLRPSTVSLTTAVSSRLCRFRLLPPLSALLVLRNSLEDGLSKLSCQLAAELVSFQVYSVWWVTNIKYENSFTCALFDDRYVWYMTKICLEHSKYIVTIKAELVISPSNLNTKWVTGCLFI